MNANQRRACDGLLPDDAPISESVEWIREQCERLQWELYATSNALKQATAKLARIENRED